MDPLTIAALVASSITALSTLITALHLRKVKLCCCITSECSKTAPTTPIERQPLLQ